MAGTGCTTPTAPLTDRRMWRLLLARLHPDVGGDNELFNFACALREEMRGAEGPDDLRATEPFLRAWRETMEVWASSNREAFKGFRAR